MAREEERFAWDHANRYREAMERSAAETARLRQENARLRAEIALWQIKAYAAQDAFLAVSDKLTLLRWTRDLGQVTRA